MRAYPDELNPTAKRLGIALIRIDARNASELPKAFATILASGANAIYMVDDAALAGSVRERKQTIAWAHYPAVAAAARRRSLSVVERCGLFVVLAPLAPAAGDLIRWASAH